MTKQDRLDVVRRAAEAGFFGPDPSVKYHATESYGEDERQLLKRFAYLVKALVDVDDLRELTEALWLLVALPAVDYTVTDYFIEKVERALRGGVDPVPKEPRTPEGWTRR